MGPKVRRLIGSLLALAIPAAGLGSLEWPVAGGVPVLTFGSHESGRFHPSMTAGPEGAQVRAIGAGEISFSFDGDRLPSGLPCPLGGFVALSHPDGMISVYARLERGSLPRYLRAVSSGDILGRAGLSGFRTGRELSFTLYDRIKRQYLNPQVLLPPVRDDRAPLVRGVYLSSGGKVLPLGETRSVRQGTYEIIADIQDPLAASDARPRAPYSIRLLVDGKEAARYLYDAARAESGRLRFFGSARLDSRSYFLPDGRIRLGSFLLARGRTTIALIVSDHAGNERETGGALQVD
ncbi:MAG TPA: M23 family metallopeptidase, partial [Spirochaetia bacterium]|nr:M23 family metallopeptidase [Spirochaetales bacterium]HRY81971.1 M23 family metallopeptidase [Spirochaetia bacterium]